MPEPGKDQQFKTPVTPEGILQEKNPEVAAFLNETMENMKSGLAYVLLLNLSSDKQEQMLQTLSALSNNVYGRAGNESAERTSGRPDGGNLTIIEAAFNAAMVISDIEPGHPKQTEQVVALMKKRGII